MSVRRLVGVSAAVTLLVGAMALPGVGAAGQADPEKAAARAERMFSRLDRDGDGRITRPEMEELRAERHARLDADQDGAVTEDEMKAAARARADARASKRFARMDADGDGRIEAAEFVQRGDRRFGRADADGDGAISREEFTSSIEAHGPRLRR